MPGPGRRLPIMLGLLLSLGACAGAPPAPEPVATPPAAATLITAPPPVAAARPPAPTPAVLKGLSDRAVTRLIGAPAFRRIDDPGAIWQYRDGTCLLDLYLHADGPVYRVRHFEFRPRGGETINPDHCFARLAARHTDSGSQTR
jgi:hypothetical protein